MSYLKKLEGLSRFVGRYGIIAISITCATHCTSTFIGEVALCSGPSMMPNIMPNDLVLVEKLSVKSQKIKNGDVVICKSPSDPQMNICKRVVAMEGEYIGFKHCEDGRSHYVVPKGHVWLEGDNRNNSKDSSSFGPVPYALIQGRAFLRIWPLDSVGVL